jgi:hypothetical protein
MWALVDITSWRIQSAMPLLVVRTIAQSLGSRTSNGAGGREALAMVDDREKWEVCEEREGEEGRGAGQNACTRSCVEVTGGIISTYLG